MLAVLLAVPAAVSAQTPEERALADARRRIEEVARQLADARRQEQAAAAAFAEADRQLRELEAAVNQMAAAVDRQREAVAEAARQLDALRADAERLADAFAVRAADLYKRGSSLPFEVLLSTGDVTSAIQRSEFVRMVTVASRADLERVTAARRRVSAQQERLATEQQRLEAMLAEQQQALAEVAALRQQRALALAAARARVDEIEHTKEDLERDARRLTALIRARQRQASSVAPSTAGYIWPLCGRVTSEFGRRWGRMHYGIDIDGNTGDPVVAAKAGVVILAGWEGGYGRLVLIDHGDGVVTGYAHLSRFAVSEGQQVARGQLVGAVGTSGNTTGSHLHFETRVNGTPVNPRRFLPPSC